MTDEAKKSLVLIGTSGSPDYLKDTTGDRRYWLGWSTKGPAFSSEKHARVEALIAMGASICDGLHDEKAPPQYLCSRCFPNGREDPSVQEHDRYEETCRDQDREME